jgi:hypothetical protein
MSEINKNEAKFSEVGGNGKMANESEKEEKAEEKITEEKPDEEESEEQPFDLSMLLPDNIDEIVKLNIFQMREWAHAYMGLIPHPKHKKVVKDLRQAKIAVDAASALTEIVLPHLPDSQQREIKILMSDLKMNFISHSSGQ